LLYKQLDHCRRDNVSTREANSGLSPDLETLARVNESPWYPDVSPGNCESARPIADFKRRKPLHGDFLLTLHLRNFCSERKSNAKNERLIFRCKYFFSGRASTDVPVRKQHDRPAQEVIIQKL